MLHTAPFLLFASLFATQDRGLLASNGLERALAIFAALDANGDGRLEAAERRRIGGVDPAQLSAADLDGDGFLARGEFLVLHRRLLQREGQVPARELELEVARFQAQRRAREVVANQEERALSAPSGPAPAPSERWAKKRAFAESSASELELAFSALEQRVLADEPVGAACDRLLEALRRTPIVFAPTEGRAESPDALVRALRDDAARGRRRSAALLSELRRILGVEAATRTKGAAPARSVDSSASSESVPAAGLGAGRRSSALADVERSLADGTSIEGRLQGLRALLAGDQAALAAVDAFDSALKRGEPATEPLARLRRVLESR